MSPSPAARRSLLILSLLAIAGGGVDAIIMLGFHVLTGAQTGNTIVLASALAQGRLTIGFHAIVSIVGYLGGAAAGELVVAGARGVTTRLTAVGRTLMAELVPLVLLLVLWHAGAPTPSAPLDVLLVALAAAAMGIQSSAVLRLHAGPTTTYVTGTLTTFASAAVRRFGLRGAATPVASMAAPSDAGFLSSDAPWLYGIAWVVYAAGALLSGLAYRWLGPVALVIPIVAVTAVVAATLSGWEPRD